MIRDLGSKDKRDIGKFSSRTILFPQYWFSVDNSGCSSFLVSRQFHNRLCLSYVLTVKEKIICILFSSFNAPAIFTSIWTTNGLIFGKLKRQKSNMIIYFNEIKASCYKGKMQFLHFYVCCIKVFMVYSFLYCFVSMCIDMLSIPH